MVRLFHVGAVLTLVSLSGCVGAPAAPYGYAPAPGYAGSAPQSQTPQAQVAYGTTCSAGVYQCVMPQETPLGAPCSCPGLGAPSYGNVR